MQNLNKEKTFFLAVNTGYHCAGQPDSRMIKFYEERSGPNIYCSIVGNVVIPGGYGTNSNCAYISSSDTWKNLADKISSNGSIPGIQLSTTWEGYSGIKKFVASSENDFQSYFSIVKDIETHTLDKIFDRFKHGAKLAIECGFKHIQIHAAHGYLLSLVIDSNFCDNHEYAILMLDKTIKEIQEKNIECSVRFSLKTGLQNLDRNRKNDIFNLMSLEPDFFDVSFGFYNINKNMIYPTSNAMLKSRIKSSLELAKSFKDKKFIISGKSLEGEMDNLPENIHLGICRDLIANPNYLVDKSKKCENCKACHYHSRGEANLSCAQW